MFTLKRIWVSLGLILVVLVGLTVYNSNRDVDAENQNKADDVIKEWDKKATPSAKPSPTQIPEPVYNLKPGELFGVVKIPAIGISFPLLEGVSNSVLDEGIGHYEKTAGPGQRGNFAVAAHRCCSNHGEPFRYLYKLNVGDVITVDTKDYRFTYKAVAMPTCGPTTGPNGSLLVDPSKVNVINPIPCTPRPPSRKLMTMTTCHPYTGGFAPFRLIKFAELTGVSSR